MKQAVRQEAYLYTICGAVKKVGGRSKFQQSYGIVTKSQHRNCEVYEICSMKDTEYIGYLKECVGKYACTSTDTTMYPNSCVSK
jgi:hypothetical protein